MTCIFIKMLSDTLAVNEFFVSYFWQVITVKKGNRQLVISSTTVSTAVKIFSRVLEFKCVLRKCTAMLSPTSCGSTAARKQCSVCRHWVWCWQQWREWPRRRWCFRSSVHASRPRCRRPSSWQQLAQCNTWTFPSLVACRGSVIRSAAVYAAAYAESPMACVYRQLRWQWRWRTTGRRRPRLHTSTVRGVIQLHRDVQQFPGIYFRWPFSLRRRGSSRC